MTAYIFPGQGAQFAGMGKDLFESNDKAKDLFLKANDILGFSITDIMFHGTDEELKQTKVTQPSVFIHSVVKYLSAESKAAPSMVAGHSLGEFSALVANGCLSFEDALPLVFKRALAMQKACEITPSTMAAVLGMDDVKVEEICAQISDEIVVAANYNCLGQLVISGSVKGVEQAIEMLKAAGAKRALMLPVGGAFHSPLMEPARIELETAINQTSFANPLCPIFQNVTAKSEIDPEKIRKNLIDQLTAPVKWTQSVQNMIAAGAETFVECGPGNVLQGLVKKINNTVQTASI